MPSDEHYSAEPGRGGPPPGDNGGGRAEPALTAEIQRQVTELAQRRHEPAVRHELLRQLADRRVAASRTPVVRFDYLPVDVGYDSLLVSGELLITQRSLPRPSRSRTSGRQCTYWTASKCLNSGKPVSSPPHRAP